MEKKIRLTHTASSGIFINIEETAIGIDLFSKDPTGLYQDTPEDLKEKLLEKIGQGEIQTLLFTHGHGDHFHLPDVMEALRRTPRRTIISTKDVIVGIQKCLSAAEKDGGGKMGVPGLITAAPDIPHLLAITPENLGNQIIKLPGMELELFNSKHMGAQYAGVQHLAVLLTVAEKKMFVPGDAWPEAELFERVAKWSS